MKITITRAALAEALSAAVAAVPSRTVLPILSTVLIEAEGAELRLSTTDLDVAVAVRIADGVEVHEPGSVAVHAKKLLDVVGKLPDGKPVVLEGRAGPLEIRSGRSRSKLHTMVPAEFPTREPVAPGGWALTAGELIEINGAVAFAASTEETRPNLNGVLWELTGKSMTAVATNGHRLVRYVRGMAENTAPEDTSLIVPTLSLALLAKVFSPGEDVQIATDGNRMVFRSDRAQIEARLIEGPYPDYGKVIPQNNDKALIVGRSALISAVRRVAALSSEDDMHRVRLMMGGEDAATLRLAASDDGVGESSDAVPASYEGDPFEIHFNGKYLLEILRKCPGDEVGLSFSTPERAAIISPAGQVSGYLFLIMPIRQK